MDIFERWFEQDLTRKVGIQHAESLAFSGNNASNVVGVYVYKDGAPAELAGTVSGTVIRPDGMTVPLTGTLSGNAVSAVLKKACFAVPGYIGVALTVTSGDITMTVLKATFEVEPIETGAVVDPSGEITANVAELISDINAAVATIPPSYSDLLAAVAPTFDPEATTPYQAGTYVWYSGALYRFTADHTAAWTGTDVVSVSVGGEISEIADALAYVRDMSPLATLGPADIVSIEDAAPLSAEGLVVDLEPKQDLHGYDAPWPAGGGKNLLPNDASFISPIGTTPYAGYVFNVPDGTHLYMSIEDNDTSITVPSNIGVGFCAKAYETGMLSQDDFVWCITNGNITRQHTNIPNSNNQNIRLLKLLVYPKTADIAKIFQRWKITVSVGDEATSYSPYSNICPITGWEGCEVKDEGKNLWNPTTEGSAEGTYNGITYTKNNDGSYTFNGTATSDTWINFGNITLPAGTFTVSYKQSGSYTGSVKFGANNGIFVSYPALSTYPITKTSDNETTGNFGINFQTNSIATNLVLRFQIELGSTATSFAPYVPPRTASVSFPETVYGCTVDLVTGECVVDRAMVDLGTLTWNGNQRFTAIVQDSLKLVGDGTVPNWVCSALMIATPNAVYGNTADYAVSYYSPSTIQARINDITDAATFKAAMFGVQLVYELATPITLNLTPAELELFKGVNNISADAGQVTVTYRQYVNVGDEIIDLKSALTDLRTGANCETVINNSLDISVLKQAKYLSDNLFNPERTVSGRLDGDGTIAPNDQYVSGDFMPVEPNTTYYFFGFRNNSVDTNAKSVVEYADDLTVLNYVNNAATSITTSANTKYVRITINTNRRTKGYFGLKEYSSANTTFEVKLPAESIDYDFNAIELEFKGALESIGQLQSPLAIVKRPPFFSWSSIIGGYIFQNYKGGVVCTRPIENFQNTGGKTYYVDVVNGNDNNDGLTKTTAFATVHLAYSQADVQTIFLMPGIYRNDTNFSYDTITKNINIIGQSMDDVVIAGGENLTTYWEPDETANVYRINTTTRAVTDVYDLSRIDTNYNVLRYTKKETVAEVSETNGSWAYVNKVLYVHTKDNRAPDANIVNLSNDTTLNINGNGNVNVFMQNLTVFGGRRAVYAKNNAETDNIKFTAIDCKFVNSVDENNDVVMIEGVKLSILKNCEASQGRKDGFNYHAKNNVITNAIEINCTGKYNGVIGNNSNQGSTIHDGGQIIRINGIYYGNSGSNIADSGAGTKSWNIGCVAFESNAVAETDSRNVNYYAYQDATVILDSCVGFGSEYNIGGAGSIYVRNPRFSGNLSQEGITPVIY